MKLTLVSAVPLLVGALVVLLTELPGVAGADASYAVLSDSMEPAISRGDLIFSREVPMSEIDKGDVIVFKLEDTGDSPLISHRVVDVRRGDRGFEYLTKGDNLDSPDGWKNQRLVAGKVVKSVSHGGDLREMVYSAKGFIAFILVPSVLVVLDQIRYILGIRTLNLFKTSRAEIGGIEA